MSEQSFIGVCGDVHGHVQLAVAAWALHVQATGQPMDALLLCGDIGTFTPDAPPDKATRRHAIENPCELEFMHWAADPQPAWIDGLFASIHDGGLGFDAPIIMVSGNHEGFDWLDFIQSDLQGIPKEPVNVDELPAVDTAGRIRLLPSGWRVRTPAGRIVGGIGGIQPGQRPTSSYPMSAYIEPSAVNAIATADRLDILITHQGPELLQGEYKGAPILDPLVHRTEPFVWLHGHSRAVKHPRIIQSAQMIPLGDATFGAARQGIPTEGWCTLTGDRGQEFSTDIPQRLRELSQGSWVQTDNGFVAPHLTSWAM